MKAYVSALNIRGTKIEGENPLPMFRDREKDKVPKLVNPLEWPDDMMINFGRDNGFKVLPYKMQDRYSRVLKSNQYKTVVLENEYLRAEFLLDFGGKLYSLTEKSTGRELLFKNPVIQIGNIAVRNAWTSGGIEWNIGIIGHTFFTCSTVYAALLKDDNNNQFVRIYEYERLRQLWWQLDFHLPKGSRTLYAHGRIVNDKNCSVPMYWWTNMAVEQTRGLRVFSSSDEIIYIVPTFEKYNRDPLEGKPSPYKFGYCKIDEACQRLGFDITYPELYKWSGDYFYLGQPDDKAPWIAAVYPDGFVFFNRSTDRLKYRKMFCWGTHNGGKKWCEYLSEKGAGYYAEIQSGMAMTQNHNLDMPANTTWEWTECFSCGILSGKNASYVPNINEAKKDVCNLIEISIPENELYMLDEKFSALADLMPVDLISIGSGFGALERKRREYHGPPVPKGLIFPDSSIGAEELPWLTLLEKGVYPEFDADVIPPSWMTDDPNWFEMLKKYIESGKDVNHSALTQYGVMLYEKGEYDLAVEMWKKSALLVPNALAYRNIAYALSAENRFDEAEEYMRKAIDCGALKMDHAFAEEYIRILILNKKFDSAWEFYNSLPENIITDKILMLAGHAALETGNEDWVLPLFKRELQNIREGDTDISDMWFKYHAIKEAKKRGVAMSKELLSEIEKTVEVPAYIDYRIVP
ncbi:MAG TPA: DUF5107 domain-containing protein [Clostridiaceae bacterium]|nr:DUF5107 domain-containing protein [Clostridiaceae bacterium]